VRVRHIFYALVARLRTFVRRDAGDADFDQEIQAHLALAEEEKRRRGLSGEQARRDARIELGAVTQLRDAARSARSLPWLDAIWLDGKLGLRMLRKSWGLTVVGGLAMALTIGLGASIFTIWNAFAGTDLPLDEGDRVIAIQSFDLASQRILRATSPEDVTRWRDGLKSVEQVSAMRAIQPVLITQRGPIGTVSAAEMTASAFRLARVRPLLGRTLVEDDELAGAEPVAVIGYDLWQSAFASDPDALGQRIQLGVTSHTIVGVMPDEFRFPVNQRLWTAFRVGRENDLRDEGAGLFVFARLAPGATLEQAQAEVTAVGRLPRRNAAGEPMRVQVRAVAYAAGVFPDVHGNPWLAGVILFVCVLLLIPPCANIAILVYARTVTRRDEFAARAVLGATRGRIVMQVFVEVLVLAACGGVVGLVFARQFGPRLPRIVMPGMGPDGLPFWMDFQPSFATVVYIGGLGVIAAAIAGGIPAFHATGGWRRSGVHALGNRGAGAGLGKTWTALLALQVALSLAILPSGIEMAWGIFRSSIVGPALPVEQYLTGQIVLEGDASRRGSLVLEAARRLAAEPGVSGVTMSESLLMGEPFSDIEIDGTAESGAQARFNSVDENYFEVFDARFVAGRRFEARDFSAATTSVIVNRSFVRELVGENVLGRRFRYVNERETRRSVAASTWYEVVGVVDDFPGSDDGPVIYHPMTASDHLVSVTIRTSSSMSAAAESLRTLSALDTNLRVGRIQSLEESYWNRRSLDHIVGSLLATVMLIALLFSMAGIYTLMAFIVARRWREIGLRSALGAQPSRLVVGIFGRAAVPLIIGAIVGCALALFIESSLPIEEAGGQRLPGAVLVSAALMTIGGLLAVVGPARRAVRIDPTEALRVN
jgi:putative ABC transport system permease protein